MDAKLLCTFTNRSELDKTLKNILINYDVYNNKIIAIYDIENDNNIFCVYNILDTIGSIEYKTISIHRIKHTNTLYTINALNQLIILKNGIIDHKYEINWDYYKNVLLLTKHQKVIKIKTKLLRVFVE